MVTKQYSNRMHLVSDAFLTAFSIKLHVIEILYSFSPLCLHTQPIITFSLLTLPSNVTGRNTDGPLEYWDCGSNPTRHMAMFLSVLRLCRDRRCNGPIPHPENGTNV